MITSLARRDTIVAACAAGLAGAITLDAFRLLVHWPNAPYLDPVARYTFNASVLVGNAAVGAPWAVPLGMLLQVIVSITWAFGYLSLAQRQPQVLRRPVISGVGFGLVVWFVMLLLLLSAGKFDTPSFSSLDRDIIAHTVFFGLPLALVAARLTPAA
jgi:hypothetical protein